MSKKTAVEDIGKHVADQCRPYLYRGADLLDTPSRRYAMATFVAAHFIGASAGFLSVAAEQDGSPISRDEAVLATLDAIRDILVARKGTA